MQEDPGQRFNIIEQHPKIAEEMRAVYDAWWKKTVPMMDNESAPMAPMRPFHVLFEEQSNSPKGIPAWVLPRL
jgi:hypothetical protein